MPSLNKAIIIGHLGQDPEARFMPDGKAVVNFSVATSEQWKDKNSGEKMEKTEWHRVTAFGKLAEIISEYCRKGGLVYIEGKLTTRKWTDKEGVDRYTTEIVADTMKMLGGKSDGRKDSGQQSKPAEKKSVSDGKPDPFDDDQIPF